MPRLREQHRASEALKAVEKLAADGNAKEIRQELQQLPSRILASGLGQTLAFYASKGKYHERIARIICEHLSRAPKGPIDFLRDLMKSDDVGTYRVHTREALAYSEWLKRYARALIPDPE